MKKIAAGLAAGAVAFGTLVALPATAQAQPGGVWSADGLTLCDPFCSNYDKTAPRFSAAPSAYVCTTGPNPASAACGVVMDVVRLLPPLPIGEFFRNSGSVGN